MITPMEITPMKKTSDQIHGLYKGCLGIYIYIFPTKTVATGPEKVIGVVVPLNSPFPDWPCFDYSFQVL